MDFNRISKSEKFEKIYKKASFVRHTPWCVLFYLASNNKEIGFVASKKVGNAVQRNRAKRLLRAIFIANRPLFKNGTFICVAKPTILQMDFENISSEFSKILPMVYRARSNKKERFGTDRSK